MKLFRPRSWLGSESLLAAHLIVLTSAFYVQSEWLFFITKPSFMDSFHRTGVIGSLGIPILALAVPGIVVSLGLSLVHRRLGAIVARLVPGFILGSALFLMIDNFTYTVLHWGIVSSNQWTRFLWIPVLAVVMKWSYVTIGQALHFIQAEKRLRRLIVGSSAFFLIFAGCLLGFEILDTDFELVRQERARSHPSSPYHPYNVIFLASDGLEAEVLSAYGFPIETTPFLSELKRESRVFENAFASAAKTTGSTTSLLNGRHPLRTKVGFPPQIFSKSDSIRHLPALLNRLGYRGYQYSVRPYADAHDLNLQRSFVEANGRKVSTGFSGELGEKLEVAFNPEIFFLSQTLDRLVSRLLHVTGLRRMQNYYFQVTGKDRSTPAVDAAGVDAALAFIDMQAGPFFMHLHLMATHCCSYAGSPSVFSKQDMDSLSAKSDRMWTARRFDAIRHSDSQFRRIYEHLKQRGILERTILVVTSDHSARWNSLERVPLIVRFPNQAHRGAVLENVSFVDVAPTILDAMALPVPSWMQGKSLIAESIEPQRPIFTVSKFEYVRSSGLSHMTRPGPPLFGIAGLGGIYCHEWKELDFVTGRVTSGQVRGHTRPCRQSQIPTDEVFRSEATKVLEQEGFVLPKDAGSLN